MNLPSIRFTYLLGFLVISILLGAASYLQIHDGITPCPLCIFQRIGLATVGVVFFFGAAINFRKVGSYFIASASCVFAIFGIVFAGRQVWLQHLPPVGSGNCGASLEYMLQVFPIQEVIKKVFIGGTECSQVTWQFLHLSLAEWSLLCFVTLLILGIVQWRRVANRFS